MMAELAMSKNMPIQQDKVLSCYKWTGLNKKWS